MSEHTPTPWCWDDQDCGNSISIRFDPQHPNAVGDEVASIYRDGIYNTDQMRADAAFIVKAVNNHEAMVKALEEIEDLGANGATAARLGNIAHAALIALTSSQGFFSGEKIAGG